MEGSPYSHSSPYTSNRWATHPHREVRAYATCPQKPLSQGLFPQSLGWLTNCLFKTWTQRAGRDHRKRKATSHWQMAGLIRQGTYTGLVMGSHKTSGSPYRQTRILEVSKEASMGFSPIHHPNGLNNIILSQGFLKWLPVQEEWVKCTFQGQERVCRASNCLGQLMGHWCSSSLSDLLQHPPEIRRGIPSPDMKC